MVIYWAIFSFTCLVAYFGMVRFRSKRKKVIAYYSEQSIEPPVSVMDGRSIGLFWAVVSFSLLIFFVGMRSGFGDTPAYISGFNAFSLDTNLLEIFKSDSDQKGYDCLLFLFKKYISPDYTVFFMALAIFQGLAIVKLYYKFSCNFFMSAFLFMASTSFTWMMNGLRQFLAVCVIMFFFDYIVDRKFFKFLLVLLVAFSIHESAIVWLPVYFIVAFKPWSFKIWACVAATLAIVFVLDQYTTFFDDSALEEMEIMSTMLNYDNGQDDGVNPIRVLIAAVPAVLAFLGRKKIKEINNPLINICINLSVVGVGIYVVGVVTSGIMVGRIPIYFTLTNYILLPWLIENVLNGKTRTAIKILCYIFYLVYFVYAFYYTGEHVYYSDGLGLAFS